jgi:hypothetical protein
LPKVRVVKIGGKKPKKAKETPAEEAKGGKKK